MFYHIQLLNVVMDIDHEIQKSLASLTKYYEKQISIPIVIYRMKLWKTMLNTHKHNATLHNLFLSNLQADTK